MQNLECNTWNISLEYKPWNITPGIQNVDYKAWNIKLRIPKPVPNRLASSVLRKKTSLYFPVAAKVPMLKFLC